MAETLDNQQALSTNASPFEGVAVSKRVEKIGRGKLNGAKTVVRISGANVELERVVSALGNHGGATVFTYERRPSSPLVARLQRGLIRAAKTQARKKRKAQSATLKQSVALPARAPLSESEIDFLETQIPAQAKAATQAAHWETLTRGRSVVSAQGDDLVEIFPDGTRQTIKSLPLKVKLPKGEIRI